MNEILKKIEDAHKTIEALNIPEMEAKMSYKDVRKEDLIALCVQQNLTMNELVVEKEVCLVAHWWVCRQLLVSFYTPYELKN